MADQFAAAQGVQSEEIARPDQDSELDREARANAREPGVSVRFACGGLGENTGTAVLGSMPASFPGDDVERPGYGRQGLLGRRTSSPDCHAAVRRSHSF